MEEQEELIIRKFRSEDALQVSRVIQKTMLVSNIADYSLDILQPLHDYFTPSKVTILASERYCLVAVYGEEIVGTGAFENGELKTIFVLPEYQSKGIGKQLIEQLEKKAKEEHVKIMKVPASISGIPFYEKLGYLKIKTFISKSAGQQTLMSKDL